jgi:hypothetical protein
LDAGDIRDEIGRHGTARSDSRPGEKGGDRDVEYLGDQRKAPGTNPVRAFFIFLHLLEGDTEALRKGPLRHFCHQPMCTYGCADFAVRRSWPPFLRVVTAELFDLIRLFFHLVIARPVEELDESMQS